MIKTNDELTEKYSLNEESNSWLFMYADGSDFYMHNILHVERNDDLMLVEGDEEASRVAEAEGVPFIYGLSGIPDGVYVDTEENRILIEQARVNY